MDNTVVVTDYRQMDKILQEERKYILNLVKTIKKSGCNVLLIQKCVPVSGELGLTPAGRSCATPSTTCRSTT